MDNTNLISDREQLHRLRQYTAPVSREELERYVHYEHIAALLGASHRLGVFVLLRRTNPESIKFVGYPGFVPKPLACKPKTAQTDAVIYADGRRYQSMCAGLVVDPRRVGADAFAGNEAAHAKAVSTWDEYWKGGPPSGFAVQLKKSSGYYGCVMRCAPGYRVFPQGRDFASHAKAKAVRTHALHQTGDAGFIMYPDRNIDKHALASLPYGCAYIHGDYDLYALVHKDARDVRQPREGQFDGQPHRYGKMWRPLEALVRSQIAIDMIQHGSQEHFCSHSDDEVDIFCPVASRDLWHVKVSGAGALSALYQNVFNGRQTV